MKKRRRKRKIVFYKNKRFLIFSLLGLFLFLGMGYSVLNTDLDITGDVQLKEYVAPTLYNVLKQAAKEGTYAREYTGSHHDSFTEEPSQKIYYWYAPYSSEGDPLAKEILDKNNVIFANNCWQMIRTTDTGGVKMIYNGEVEDGKCLNTRGNHVGYAARTTKSMSTTYYYGTDYTYDKTNNVFSLSGTTSTGEIKVGEYTCRSTTADGTCATLYLVDTLSNGTTYNVLPLNGNSHYSQFGTLQFNQNMNSPSHVGYMYNTVYPYQSKTMTNTETILYRTTIPASTNYWYADSVTWGVPIANRYNLDNPYQITLTDDYSNSVGKYTFFSRTQTYTDTRVVYVEGVEYSVFYYFEINNTNNQTLSDFNYTYTFGDSYTDNGDGTYTIDSPTTIERKNWYTSYSDVGAGKYVCKNAVNNTCTDLWYTTATTTIEMTYIPVANNYKYAKGFTWDGSKYILDNDTSTSFWNINDSTNKASINNAHYTCWNESGECSTISYIYYIGQTTPFYINITNGESVEDAVKEMLYNDDVNTTNSTIKTGVDAWYKKYLLDYSEKLEDTIFCNDRSIRDLGGWNPDGGSTTSSLRFKEATATRDLSCTNETDQFSVSNNKAKLIYKVGLMSAPEINILNNYNIRKTEQPYYLASPCYFGNYDVEGLYVNTNGDIRYSSINGAYGGVRPAVSLVTGTRYTSGNGSMANPYVVDTN